jgi:hypothetical protein
MDLDQYHALEHALECIHPADRARLTKIVEGLDTYECNVVNESIGYHLREFNYRLSETPGSAGQIAYAALVDAIKAVKTGVSPTKRPLLRR